MKTIKNLISCSLALFFLYACTPANILGTGAGSAMVIAEGDRSMGTVIDDATIKVNIAAKFISSEDNLFVDVSTTVLNGRVLMTGLVDNQEVRIDAVRRVWEVEGVQEVINEIQIGNRASLKEYANDVWINTQAKGLAAKAVGLRVVAYNFETIQGKVYIAGITSRPEQLEDLINAVKTIKGVKEIVNYVIIKEN
jgi:osmotically-inducible protein OsmY